MKSSIALTVLAVLAAALAGCHSNKAEPTTFGSVSWNPTPDVQTLDERPIDIDAHIAAANDHDLRNFSHDLGRVFYTDHPSRLSPFPITYTSGQPR